MQNDDIRSSRGQNIMIAVLLVMTAICGLLLVRNSRPVYAEPARTEPAVTATTAASGTAAVTAAAKQTAETTAVTEPDDSARCLEFLTEKLIPDYGLADDSGVLSCSEQTGIAGACLFDMPQHGTMEMLVIRLETLDTDHAAAPVFDWYTCTNGTVTLTDSFSCKMPWSDIAVRYSNQMIFVSACDIPLDENAENRKYAELTVSMQDSDMQTMNIEQEYGNVNRPAAQYGKDAVLLLTVEPDRTQTPGSLSERRYLLTDYTGMRELLTKAEKN